MSSHSTAKPSITAVPSIQQRKVRNGRKAFAMLTAYDALTAKTLANAGIEVILVGDSLAMTQLGHENTLSLTVEEMGHHVAAVTRGIKAASHQPLIIADMPFMSVGNSVDQGVSNAGRMLKEYNAHAVKVEGASTIMCETIRRCVGLGIPVMGHLGLTPQSVNQLGGFKLQSNTAEAAKRLLQDALTLQQCGVFALVLEMVPVEVANMVTDTLTIPTIGIGAGAGCDGQVLVIDDLLGRDNGFSPKFLRRYANVEATTTEAVQAYKTDVAEGAFPDNNTEAYHLKADQREDILSAMKAVINDYEVVPH